MNAVLTTFGIYIAVILLATYVVSRRLTSVDVEEYQSEFYVGNRDLGMFVTAILIAAGAVSTGTFIGTPGYIWEFGPAFGIYILAQGPMNLYLLGIYGKKVSVVSRRIDANSLIDIYKERYEAYTPLVVTLALAIVIFLEAYLAAEFVGGARIVATVTDLSYLISLLIFGGIIILYTTLGGLRGAGMIGIIQGAVMTLGTLALLGVSFTGVDNIYPTIAQFDTELLVPPGRGVPWFEFLSLWVTFTIGLLGLPHALQGVLGMDSSKTLRRSAGLGVGIVFLWSIVVLIAGSAGKALNPEGITPDQNIPLFALETLPDPLAGVVLAGIVGAAQTTVASMSILVSSAVVVNIYEDYLNPELSAQGRKYVSGGVTAIVGLVGMLIAVIQPPLLQVIVVFAIGGLATSLAPPLLLGLFWPRTNKYGAFAGSFVGLLSYIGLKQWGPGLIGSSPISVTLLIAFTLTVVVSLLTAKPSKEVLQIYFGASQPSATDQTAKSD